MFTKTAVLLFSALYSVRAANIDVNVGPGLTYTPDHVTAASGDTVTFHFLPGQHTVTQSSFENPCARLSDGFDSGLRPGSSDGSDTYVVNVTDTTPVWIYCATPAHCTGGMVFAINAEDAQFAEFQAAAEGGGGGGSSSTTPGGSGSSTASSPTSASSPAATTTSSTGQGFASTQVATGMLAGLLVLGSAILAF
ncbi:hypothetical protein CPB86DRAFT_784438 [Serendipita vermifera]|nr:hypothetical protein CPB86DRAFT_784438 [Serendipita vermifera]